MIFLPLYIFLIIYSQASVPGIGQALVRQLAEHYQARGRHYMDLSVMHDNSQAIRLYEKLGFNEIGVRRNYYPAHQGREDALLLALSLD